MSDPLDFTRATDADWAEIWPIWHQITAAGDTYCYDPHTSSDDARTMWLGGAAGMETWVARGGGQVVGLYEISRNQSGPGSHVANGSYMVADGIRGKGIGRQLVLHSLQRAKDLGYRGVQFNAVAATNVHAIGLYERLGFTTIGRVPGGFRHPEQGFVDLQIMYRPL
ncbi:MAG: GNAT family N-acetyltransferase [Jatrophihabitans sp.]